MYKVISEKVNSAHSYWQLLTIKIKLKPEKSRKELEADHSACTTLDSAVEKGDHVKLLIQLVVTVTYRFSSCYKFPTFVSSTSHP